MRWLQRHVRPEQIRELSLLFLILVAIVVFGALIDGYYTSRTFNRIASSVAIITVVAVGQTLVVLTRNIDLSVGSLMGLSAVLFGMLYSDAGFPIAAAAGVTLLVGAAAGALNALLITWLRLPPLIVTLGTFSLFRGLAEGITRGVANYATFPDSFLFLGQGYLTAGVPTQLPIFVAVVIGYWILLQRTTIGRGSADALGNSRSDAVLPAAGSGRGELRSMPRLRRKLSRSVATRSSTSRGCCDCPRSSQARSMRSNMRRTRSSSTAAACSTRSARSSGEPSIKLSAFPQSCTTDRSRR